MAMRRPGNIEREMLNAYVDGELPHSDAARVARAAAQDPLIAAQIATLRELKAAIPETVPERKISLPQPSGLQHGPVSFAIAACALLMVATGFIYLFLQPVAQNTSWSQALYAEHEAWTFSPAAETAGLKLASGPANLLPLDLKAARLTFVGHQEISISGNKVLQTGYEGTRGCRVSLFVLPAGIKINHARFPSSLLVRTWEIGSQGFALMADGMARARFNGLSVAVEKALRDGLQPDVNTRQKLAHARRTSPPCQA